MTFRNRIPTALETHLRLPPETALILLTGTLGCSVNWLTARFAGSLLLQPNARDGEAEVAASSETSVVLVSFLRDAVFWQNELKRAAGTDASKLSQLGRFTFIDCLNVLADTGKAGSGLKLLETTIKSAITTATNQAGYRKVVLMLDSPDVLLALNLTTTQALNDLVLELRSLVHSSIIACSSDLPLLAAATGSSEYTTPTPIEAEAAAFAVQQAHNALFAMSVRELTTGAAKDVSGVLSVTRGGSYYEWSDGDELLGPGVKEVEALYLVQRDGSAKVFERGSSGV